MVDVYLPRFAHLISAQETVLNVGAAYNVQWAMANGDSRDNGLLVVSDSRVFHCLDYGIKTWQTSRASLIGSSASSHPMPFTDNLHLTYLLNDVHAQVTFYAHPRFCQEVRRILAV
jgi:hypothetical protein